MNEITRKRCLELMGKLLNSELFYCIRNKRNLKQYSKTKTSIIDNFLDLDSIQKNLESGLYLCKEDWIKDLKSICTTLSRVYVEKSFYSSVGQELELFLLKYLPRIPNDESEDTALQIIRSSKKLHFISNNPPSDLFHTK